MAGRSVINVLVNADTRDFVTGMDTAGRKVGSFATNAIKDVAKFTTALAGAGAIAAVAFGKQAVGAASDLAESTNAVNVTFGDAAEGVLALSDASATAVGMSASDFNQFAVQFAGFTKNIAGSDKEIAGVTDDLTTRIADFASVMNLDIADAAHVFQSSLAGESESARRFGIDMSAAAVEAYAIEEGMIAAGDSMTEAEKVQARYGLMMESTNQMAGDFANTSDGLANQQRIMSARFEDVKAKIGAGLIPILEKFAGFVLDKVIPGVEKLIGVFEKDGLKGVIDMLVGYVKDKGPAVLDQLRVWAETAGSWIVNTGLPLLAEKARQLGSALVDWIAPRIDPMLEKVGELLGRFGEFLIDVWYPFLWEKLGQLGQALVDWIGPKVKPALEKLGEWAAKLAQWIVDDGVPMLREKLVQLGDEFVAWIGPKIVPMLAELGILLGKIAWWIVTEAVPKIAVESFKMGVAFIQWVDSLGKDIVDGLGNFIVELGDWMVNAGVPKMIEFGKDLGVALRDGIVDLLSGAWSGASTFARGLANSIIGFVNDNIIDRLNGLLEFEIGLPFGQSFRFNAPDIPNLPQLADGGIVRSPTLALIGEAGPEAVVPLNRRGMSSGLMGGVMNITINPPAGSSGPAIVEALKREVRRGGQLRVATTGAVRGV